MADKQSAYVSPEDAAVYFDTTPEKIRRLCRDGKIPGARKLGREWRIPRSFLDTDVDTVQKMAEDEDKK